MGAGQHGELAAPKPDADGGGFFRRPLTNSKSRSWLPRRAQCVGRSDFSPRTGHDRGAAAICRFEGESGSSKRHLRRLLHRLAGHVCLDVLDALDAAEMLRLEAAVFRDAGRHDAHHGVAVAQHQIALHHLG